MKEQRDETASEECVHVSGADDAVSSSRGPGLLPASATGTPVVCGTPVTLSVSVYGLYSIQCVW